MAENLRLSGQGGVLTDSIVEYLRTIEERCADKPGRGGIPKLLVLLEQRFSNELSRYSESDTLEKLEVEEKG